MYYWTLRPPPTNGFGPWGFAHAKASTPPSYILIARSRIQMSPLCCSPTSLTYSAADWTSPYRLPCPKLKMATTRTVIFFFFLTTPLLSPLCPKALAAADSAQKRARAPCLSFAASLRVSVRLACCSSLSIGVLSATGVSPAGSSWLYWSPELAGLTFLSSASAPPLETPS